MNKKFLEKIFLSHQHICKLPNAQKTEEWIESLLGFLFPARSSVCYQNADELRIHGNEIVSLFKDLCRDSFEGNANVELIGDSFFQNLEFIHQLCMDDATAIYEGDPAASSLEEVIGTYPGFYAISIYRIAHQIYNWGVPYLPRLLSEIAHSKTGIDIHPGATIGKSMCIDHGTGIVIGETTMIGNYVKIYQGVTLGALSVSKDMAKSKRHPSIEDHVVIYSGSTILGGNTVIGSNSIIGGNVWLTESVPSNSFIYYSPAGLIKRKKNEQ